jgi:hypothetical protein
VDKIGNMERKKAFEPGDMISTFTRQAGMVISQEIYSKVRNTMKEKKRPGHYFAPGCCTHPDYVIQVPVLFEDGTYDVMRAMNIKKTPDTPPGKKAQIQSIIDDLSA